MGVEVVNLDDANHMQRCEAYALLAWFELVNEAEKHLPILVRTRCYFVYGNAVKDELRRILASM